MLLKKETTSPSSFPHLSKLLISGLAKVSSVIEPDLMTGVSKTISDVFIEPT